MIYTPSSAASSSSGMPSPALDLAFPLLNLLDELGVAEHLKGS